ncbi:protein AHNAK2 isoform X2 [Chamaea fasciata]
MEVTLKTEVEAGASGFSVKGGGNEGLFIKKVLKESPASKIFSLREGDQLLSATIFFDNIKYEDALKILQYSEPYRVQFSLKRKIAVQEDLEHSAAQHKKERIGQEKELSESIPEETLHVSGKAISEEDRETLIVSQRIGRSKRPKKDRLSWPKFQSIKNKKILRHRRSHSTSDAYEPAIQDISPTSTDTESQYPQEVHTKEKKGSQRKLKFPSIGFRIHRSKPEPQEKQKKEIKTTLISEREKIYTDDISLENPEILTVEYTTSPGYEMKTGEGHETLTKDLKEIKNGIPSHVKQCPEVEISIKKDKEATSKFSVPEVPTDITKPSLETADLKVSPTKKSPQTPTKSRKKKQKGPADKKDGGSGINTDMMGHTAKGSVQVKGLEIGTAKAELQKSDALETGEKQAEEDTQILTIEKINYGISMTTRKEIETVTSKQGGDMTSEDSRNFNMKILMPDAESEVSASKIQMPSFNVAKTPRTDMKITREERGEDKEGRVKKEGIEEDGMPTDEKAVNIEGGMKTGEKDIEGKDSKFRLPKLKFPTFTWSTTKEEKTQFEAQINEREVQVQTLENARGLQESGPTREKTVQSDEMQIGISKEKTDQNNIKKPAKGQLPSPKKEKKPSPMEINIKETSGKIFISKIDTEIEKREFSKKTKDEIMEITPSDIKAPKVDISLPSVDVTLPQTSVDLQAPEATLSLEGEAKVPEKEAAKTKDGKFKMPKFGMPSFGWSSSREAKGSVAAEVDVSLKEPEVTVPSAAAEVDVTLPSADIQVPGVEVTVETGTIAAEGEKGRFKMPSIKLPKVKAPHAQVSLPKAEVSLAKGQEGEVALQSPEAEASLEVAVGKAEAGGMKIHMPKVKMPSVAFSKPTVKAPKLDADVSLLQPELKAADADVSITAPDIKLASVEGSLELQAPDIDLKVPSDEGKLKLEGTGLKGKLKMPKADIKAPMVDISLPSVDVTLPQASVDLQAPEATLSLEGEAKVPEKEAAKTKDGKFKMPKFGMPSFGWSSSREAKGSMAAEVDVSLKEPEVTMPSAAGEVDVTLPSADVQVPGLEVTVETGAIAAEGEKGRFKMPDVKMPSVKLPKVKAPHAQVSLPKAEVSLAKGQEGEVALQSPEAEASLEVAAGKAEAGGMKIHMPKVKVPSVAFSKPTVKAPKLDTDVSLPEAELKAADADISIAAPDIKLPSVEGSLELQAPDIDLKVPSAEGKLELEGTGLKGKLKFPKFDKPKFAVSSPKTEAPTVEVSLPSAEVELPSATMTDAGEGCGLGLKADVPGAKTEDAGWKLEKPSLKMPKADIKAPKVDISLPSVDVTLPQASVDLQAPEATLSLEGEAKVPEKEAAKTKDGKFKMPKFGMPSFGWSSSRDAKGSVATEVDVSLKEPEVTVPSAAAEVDVTLPSADIQVPGVEVTIETGTIAAEGEKGRFKMPSVKLPKVKAPHAQVSLPKAEVSLAKGQEGEVALQSPEAEASLEVAVGKAEAGGMKIHMPKVKMPSVAFSKPTVKAPKLDADVSLPQPELKAADADVSITAPDIKLASVEGSLELQAPDIDLKVPSDEGKLKLEGTGLKGKLKMPKADIKAPKVDISLPSVDVTLPQASVDLQAPEATLSLEGEAKVPEKEAVKTKDGKFKMPKFGMPSFGWSSSREAKGSMAAEVDVSLKEPEVTMPSAAGEVDVTLPSADVQVPGLEVTVETGAIAAEGEKGRFKMPDVKMPSVKLPKVKAPHAQVSLPKAEVSLAKGQEGEVALQSPEAEASLEVAAGKAEAGGMKIHMPKVKVPSVVFSKPTVKAPKLDADVSLPEAELKAADADISIADPNIKLPSIEGSLELQAPDIDLKVPSAEGKLELEGTGLKGKLKFPKFDKPKFAVSSPKTEAPTAEVSLPSTEVELPSATMTDAGEGCGLGLKADVPGAKTEDAGWKLEKPSLKMPKADIKAPKVDISLPSVDVTLPQASVDLQAPEATLSLEGEAKVPEKEAAKTKDGKFKMPKFGMPSFGWSSSRDAKGSVATEVDVSLKEPEVTVPSAAAEVDVTLPSADIQVPGVEVTVETGTIAAEGEKGRFKMPSVKLPKVKAPHAQVSLPKAEVSLAKGQEGEVALQSPEAEASLEVAVGKAEAGGMKIHMPKVKMPSVAFSKPTVKAPKLDADVSLPQPELKAADADVSITAPDIKLASVEGSLELQAPDIDLKVPSDEGKLKLEGTGLKGKLKMPKADIKAPKVDISLPSVDVTLPQASVDLQAPEATLSLEGEAKVPEKEAVKTKDGKFKMPKFGMPSFGWSSSREAKGSMAAEVDVSLKEPEVTMPSAAGEVDVTLPSADVQVPGLEVTVETGAIAAEGEKGRFKMPDVKMPSVKLPKVKAPHAQVSLPKAEVSLAKGQEGEVALQSPEAEASLEVAAGKAEAGGMKIHMPKVKVPSVVFSKPTVKAPKLDADVSLPEAELKAADADISIADPNIKLPSIEGSLELQAPDIDLKVPSAEGKLELEGTGLKGKLKFPKFDKPKFAVSSPKTEAPTAEVSLPSTEVELPSATMTDAGEGCGLGLKADVPGAKTEDAGWKLEKPSLKMPKADIKAPKVDISLPSVDVTLPQASVDLQAPEATLSLEGEAKVPEKEAAKTKDGKFKMPKFGMPSFGWSSSRDAKGSVATEVDVSLKEPEVTVPSAAAEVDVTLPSADIQVPGVEVTVETGTIAAEGEKGRFKMPSVKLPKVKAPHAQVSLPKAEVSLAKGQEGEVALQSPEAEASLEVAVGKAEAGGMKIHMPKVKMPSVAFSKPTVKAPKLDADVSLPQPELKAADADVSITAPDIKLASVEGSLELQAPDIDLKVPSDEGKLKLEGTGLKGKLKMPKADIKAPKVDISLPSVDVTLPQASVDLQAPEATLSLEGEAKVPEKEAAKTKDGKFKMPKFGMPSFGWSSSREAKGSVAAEVDVSLKEPEVTMPSAAGEVDVTLPSADVQVPGLEVTVETGAIAAEGEKGRFKMPDVKMPSVKLPKVKAPHAQVSLPKAEVSLAKGQEGEVALQSPEAEARLEVAAGKAEAGGMKIHMPKVKVPSVAFSKPTVKAPKLDTDVSLPEAQLKAADADISIAAPDIKLPSIEGSLELQAPDIDLKVPSAEGKLELEGTGLKGKLKFPKFDKPKFAVSSPKAEAPTAEVSLPSAEVELPSATMTDAGEGCGLGLKADVPGAKTKDAGWKLEKPSLKMPKADIKAPKVDISLPSVDITLPQASVDLQAPEATLSLEGEAKVPEKEAAKTKDGKFKMPKFGMPSFGWSSSRDAKGSVATEVDVSLKEPEVTVPSAAAEVDVTLPSADIQVPGVEVTVETGTIAAEGEKGRFKMPSVKLPKVKAPHAQVSLPKAEVSLAKGQEGEVALQSPEAEASLEVAVGKAEAGGMKIHMPKVKVPSVAFSKPTVKAPKLDADVSLPQPELKAADADVSITAPDIKLASVEGSLELQAPDIDLKVPSDEGKLKLEGTGLKGKLKMPKADIKAPKVDISLPSVDVTLPQASVDLQAPEATLSLEGEAKVPEKEAVKTKEGKFKMPKFGMPSFGWSSSREAKGSMAAEVDVSLKEPEVTMPSAAGEVDVTLPSADVQVPGLEVTVETGAIAAEGEKGRFKMPDVKMPSVKLPKVKAPHAQVSLPKAEVSLAKGQEGEVALQSPEAEASLEVAAGKAEAGGMKIHMPKVKVPSVAFSKPTVKAPKLDADVSLPEAQLKAADADISIVAPNIKLPSIEGSLELQAPDIDLKVPSAEGKLELEGTGLKGKLKFPKFDKPKFAVSSPKAEAPTAEVSLPSAEVELPSATMTDAGEGCGLGLKADVPGAKTEDAGWKLEKPSLKMPKADIKAPKVDISLPSVDVTLPQASVDLQAPEATLSLEGEAKVPEKEAAKTKDGKFKMPKFGMPSFGWSSSREAKGSVAAEVDVSLKEPEVTVPSTAGEVDVTLPSADIQVPGVEVTVETGTIAAEGEKGRFKMPSVKLPKVKAPHAQVSLPKAEVSLAKGQEGEVALQSPEAEASLEVAVGKAEAGGMKIHMPKVKMPSVAFSKPTVKAPKLDADVSLPQPELKAADADVSITAPDIKLASVEGSLELQAPDIDLKVPSDEGKLKLEGTGLKGKLKMPKADIKAPKVDISLPSVDVTLPQASVDLQAPEATLSLEGEAKVPEKEAVKTKEGKFKMPKFGMPSFGWSSSREAKGSMAAEVDVSLKEPEVTMPSAAGEVDVTLPSADVQVPGLEVTVETGAIAAEGEKGRFKMPDVKMPSVKLPKVKAPHAQVSLPKAEVSLAKGQEGEVALQSPEAEASLEVAAGKAEAGGMKIHMPKVKVPSVAFSKPTVKAPKLDADVSLPEAQLKAADADISIVAPNIKLPSIEGSLELQAPDIDLKVPSAEGKLELEGTGLKGKLKFPKFDKPKFAVSSPKAEAPTAEVSLPSAEVEIPSATMTDAGEGCGLGLKADVPGAKTEDAGWKLEKPSLKMPKADIKAPKVDISLPSVDVTLPQASVDLQAPEATLSLEGEAKVPEKEAAKTKDGKFKMPKFGMPSFGWSSSREAKGSMAAEVDVSLKEPEVTMPSAAGEVDVTLPSADVQVPGLEVTVETGAIAAEGEKGRFKMPDVKMPSVKLPKVKAPHAQVSLPKAEVSLAKGQEGEVALQSPEAEASLEVAAGKAEAGGMKIHMPKVKVPSVAFSKPTVKAPKLDADVSLPEAQLKAADADISIAAPNIKLPSIEGSLELQAPDIDLKVPSAEGKLELEGTGLKGKLKFPKFDKPKFAVSSPKAEAPTAEVSLPSAEVEIPSATMTDAGEGCGLGLKADVPGAKTEDAGWKLEKPSLKMPKADIKAPKVDISLPSVDVTLPQASVDLQAPEATLSLEGEAKVPEKEAAKTKDGKFKMPKFGMPSFGWSSSREAKGSMAAEVDVSLKEPEVTMPSAAGEVDVTLPSADIQVPGVEVTVETGTIAAEGEKGRFKMPSVKLPKVKAPHAQVSLPKAEVSLAKGQEGEVALQSPEAEASLEVAVGKAEAGGMKIHMPKVKMPSVAFSKPTVKAPKLDADVSLPEAELKAPDADISITAPDIKLASVEGSLELQAPDIDLKVPSDEGKLKLEGTGLKGKLKMPKADIKAPKVDISLPSVNVTLPQASVDLQAPEATLSLEGEAKVPEKEAAKTKDGKFKMPKFGMPSFGWSSSREAKGSMATEVDVSLKEPEATMSLGAVEVDMTLHDSEIQAPSFDIPPDSSTLKEDDIGKSKGYAFRMPKISFSKSFKPHAQNEPGFDVSVSETVCHSSTDVTSSVPSESVGPKLLPDVKGECLSKSSKFRVPSIGFSKAEGTSSKIDMESSLQKGDITLTKYQLNLTESRSKIASIADENLSDFEILSEDGSEEQGDFKLEGKTTSGEISLVDTEVAIKIPKFRKPKFRIRSKEKASESDIGFNVESEISKGKMASDMTDPDIEKPAQISDAQLGVKLHQPSLEVVLDAPTMDPSLSPMEITLPKLEAEIHGPDLECKAEHEVVTGEKGTEEKEHKFKPSKFKLPSFRWSPKKEAIAPSHIEEHLEGPTLSTVSGDMRSELTLPAPENEYLHDEFDTTEKDGEKAKTKKSQFTMPKISFPKIKGQKVQVSLPILETDVSGPTQEEEGVSVQKSEKGSSGEGAGLGTKVPKVTIPTLEFSKPEAKVPKIETDINMPTGDITVPICAEDKLTRKSAAASASLSTSDIKMIPEHLLDLKSPDISVERTSGEIAVGDVEIKAEGSEGKTKMSKFQMPKVGITLSKGKGSEKDVGQSKSEVKVPQLKATVEISDIAVEAPDLEVECGTESATYSCEAKISKTDSEASEADVHLPSADISIPKTDSDIQDSDAAVKIKGEIKQDGDGEEKEGHFKMPKFKLPSFSWSPKKEASVKSDSGGNLEDQKLAVMSSGIDTEVKGTTTDDQRSGPELDLEISAGKVEQKSPIKKPQFVMPKISLSKIKVPKSQSHSPKVEANATLPKTEIEADNSIKIPDIEKSHPEGTEEGAQISIKLADTMICTLEFSRVETEASKTEITVSSAKTDASLTPSEGSFQQVDLKISSTNECNIQKTGIKLPKGEASVDLKSPDILTESSSVVDGRKVKLEGPEGKIKMPKFQKTKFGISLMKGKVPETEISTPKIEAEPPQLRMTNEIADIAVGVPASELTSDMSDPGVVDVKIKTPQALTGGIEDAKVDISTQSVSKPKTQGVFESLEEKEIKLKEHEIKAEEVQTEEHQGWFKMPKFRIPAFGRSSFKEKKSDAVIERSMEKTQATIPSAKVQTETSIPGNTFSLPHAVAEITIGKEGIQKLGDSMKSSDVSLPKMEGDISLSTERTDSRVNIPKTETYADIVKHSVERHTSEITVSAAELSESYLSASETDKDKSSANTFPEHKGKSRDTEIPKVENSMKFEISGVGCKPSSAEITLDATQKKRDVSLPKKELDIQNKETAIKKGKIKGEVKIIGKDSEEGQLKRTTCEWSTTKGSEDGTYVTAKLGDLKVEVPTVKTDVKITTVDPEVKFQVKSVEKDVSAGVEVQVEDRAETSKIKAYKFKIPKFGMLHSEIKGFEDDTDLPKSEADSAPKSKRDTAEMQLQKLEGSIGLESRALDHIEASARITGETVDQTQGVPEVTVRIPKLKIPRFTFRTLPIEADVLLSKVVTDPKGSSTDIEIVKLQASSAIPEETPRALEGGIQKAKSKILTLTEPDIKTAQMTATIESSLSSAGQDIHWSYTEGQEVSEKVEPEHVAIERCEIYTTEIVKESEILSSEVKTAALGFSLLKTKLPESHSDLDVLVQQPSAMGDASVRKPTGAGESFGVAAQRTGSAELKLSEKPHHESEASRGKVSLTKLKTSAAEVKCSSKLEESFPDKSPEGITAAPPSKDEDVVEAAEGEEKDITNEKEKTDNKRSPGRFKFWLPSIGFSSSGDETSTDVKPEIKKSVPEDVKPADTSDDSSKQAEKAGWFRFPKLGFTSPSKKAKSVDKEEVGHKEERLSDEDSPTDKPDVFFDAQESLSPKEIGEGEKSEIDGASSIVTSSARTELILLEEEKDSKSNIVGDTTK